MAVDVVLGRLGLGAWVCHGLVEIHESPTKGAVPLGIYIYIYIHNAYT